MWLQDADSQNFNVHGYVNIYILYHNSSDTRTGQPYIATQHFYASEPSSERQIIVHLLRSIKNI